MSASSLGRSVPAEAAPAPAGGGLLYSLRRRWWLALLCLVVGAASAGFISAKEQKQYESTAKILFRNDTTPDQSLQSVLGLPPIGTAQDPTQQAATNVALVSVGTVANMTAAAIGHGTTGGAVQSEIAVSEVGQSNVISIIATDPSPRRAAVLANTFARQVMVFTQNTDRSVIQAGIQRLQAELAALPPSGRSGPTGRTLASRIQELTQLAQVQLGNAEVVQNASIPTSPSLPRTKVNIAVGAALGLLLGIALALLFSRVDRRLRTPEELSEEYGLPLLGLVPHASELKSSRRGGSILSPPTAEAFRAIRARLRYFNVDHTLHSLLVTSAAPGEGKSTISWQLARVMGLSTKGRVLLLEADLRKPVLAEALGLAEAPGLAELLADRLSVEDVVQKVAIVSSINHHGRNGRVPDRDDEEDRDPLDDPDTPTLDVIVSGVVPPNPSELLDSGAMSEFLRSLGTRYEFVIVDAPPGALVSDTLPLATRVSGVLVVSSVLHASKDSIEWVRSQLETVKAPMLGVVVNNVKHSREERYSGYYRRKGDSIAGPVVRTRVDQEAEAPVAGEEAKAPVAEHKADAAEHKADAAEREPDAAEREPEHVSGNGNGAGPAESEAEPEGVDSEAARA